MNPRTRELLFTLGIVQSHLNQVIEKHPHLHDELHGVMACVDAVLLKAKNL